MSRQINSRQVAFEALFEVIANGKYSNILLPQMLQKTELENRDRAFVTDLVYGTLRQQSFLDSAISQVADRNLSDKIELTERRIMDEFKALREHITEHNKKEDEELEALAKWKWMVAGGVVVVAWIVSNIRLDYLVKLFN